MVTKEPMTPDKGRQNSEPDFAFCPKCGEKL